MNYIDEIMNYALLLIYPDGQVDIVPINYQALHMEYFIELKENSTRFNKILTDNHFSLPTDFENTRNAITVDLDTLLAINGIVAFHNLLIVEIKSKRFNNNELPKEFYVSVPDDLTDEQLKILRTIFKRHDMSYGMFCELNGSNLVDISYEDMLSIVKHKKRK